MPQGLIQQKNNELFISYSRKNNTFVQHLIGGLQTKGIGLWFDQEDIDQGRKWWDEVKRGIIGSNAFIFVVSPDALRSQVCHWELAFARQHNKRIIPLLIDDQTITPTLETELQDLTWRNPEGEQVKAVENWLSLQAINFIVAQEFTPTLIDQIIGVARADFEYIDAHKRFLVRAHEWELKGKKSAFVLTGGDLTEAQTWLTVSTQKEPQPLALHREYIAASLRRAKRQRQRLLIATLGSLVIIAVVAFFGWRQSQVAEERDSERATQQAIAEREAAIALSRKLATNAQSIASDATKYDLALLLSAEAYRQNPTYEAYDSLLSLFQQKNRPIGYFPIPADSSVSEVLARSPIPELITYREFNSPVPDNERYQFDSAVENNIFLGIRNRIEPDDGWITSSLWSLNGDLLAVAFCAEWEGEHFCDSNVIQIYDLNSGHLVTEIAGGHQHVIVAMAFRPDNQHLATASRDGTARIWEVATGEELLVIDHPYEVLSVVYSPNGDMLATGTGAGGIEITVSVETAIRLWDANSGELRTTLEGTNVAVEQVQFSTDGTRLASWGLLLSTGEPRVLMWDLTGSFPLEEWSDDIVSFSEASPPRVPTDNPFDYEEAIIAMSDDLGLVAESQAGSSIIIIEEANSGESLAQLFERDQVGSADPNNYAATSAQFSPDNRHLVSTHVDGAAKLWNIRTSELMLKILQDNLVLDKFDFDPTGEILAIGGCEKDITRTCSNGVVYVVDVSSAQLLGSPIQVDIFQHMFFNETGQLVLAFNDHSVIWDISPHLFIVRACMIVNRDLTQEEWSLYLGNLPYRRTCSEYMVSMGGDISDFYTGNTADDITETTATADSGEVPVFWGDFGAGSGEYIIAETPDFVLPCEEFRSAVATMPATSVTVLFLGHPDGSLEPLDMTQYGFLVAEEPTGPGFNRLWVFRMDAAGVCAQ